MKPKKVLLDEMLDDQEKLAIQMFIDNPVQAEAVKKILLFSVYEAGMLKKGQPANPLRNFALSFVSNQLDATNEQIGQKLRASWEGIQFIESAWQELELYKKQEPTSPKKENPAR